MVYLLPILGILLLFIGISIFIILFLFDNQRQNLLQNAFSNPYASDPFSTAAMQQTFLLQSQNQEMANKTIETASSTNKDKIKQYLLHQINWEKEEQRRLTTLTLTLTVGLFFVLFFYLIGGAIILWYFREAWHFFTLVKLLFLFLYFIGLVLLGLAIGFTMRAYRIGEFPLQPYMQNRLFPVWLVDQDMVADDIKTLREEMRSLYQINFEKRRALNGGKYLSLFLFFNIFILAIILLVHYYNYN